VGGPHVRSGALRGLGVTTATAWRDLPGVPSFQEQGMTGFEAPTWWAVFAPSAVPPAIRDRMARLLGQILAEPETKARVEQQGMDVLALSGEGFANFAEAETERWARVVRANNIRLDG
jgi:tripartite-type tricarboxylate transporter receptor subunit TctC